MKKIFKNIGIIFVLLILTISFATSTVQATSEIIDGGKSFIQAGKDENQKKAAIDEDKMKKTSDYIYNILLAIATVIAVIMASIIGIKLMTASVEEKAEIKESIAPFVVGCIIVFGAFGIWKAFIQVANSIDDAATVSCITNETYNNSIYTA